MHLYLTSLLPIFQLTVICISSLFRPIFIIVLVTASCLYALYWLLHFVLPPFRWVPPPLFLQLLPRPLFCAIVTPYPCSLLDPRFSRHTPPHVLSTSLTYSSTHSHPPPRPTFPIHPLRLPLKLLCRLPLHNTRCSCILCPRHQFWKVLHTFSLAPEVWGQ